MISDQIFLYSEVKNKKMNGHQKEMFFSSK